MNNIGIISKNNNSDYFICERKIFIFYLIKKRGKQCINTRQSNIKMFLKKLIASYLYISLKWNESIEKGIALTERYIDISYLIKRKNA